MPRLRKGQRFGATAERLAPDRSIRLLSCYHELKKFVAFQVASALQRGDNAFSDQIGIAHRPGPSGGHRQITPELTGKVPGRRSPVASVKREVRDVVNEAGVEKIHGVLASGQRASLQRIVEQVPHRTIRVEIPQAYISGVKPPEGRR